MGAFGIGGGGRKVITLAADVAGIPDFRAGPELENGSLKIA